MKKRIFILIIPLLFMTGCSCEYNLKIEENTFKEEIKLIADDQAEVSLFNEKWEVSSNKNQNVPGGDPSTAEAVDDNMYKYNLSNNMLTFNYDFSQNGYRNSTAVSKCYNNFTVTNYQNSIIISTPSKAICFDNYPSLNNIVINITTDKEITSNNADSSNGNTYTWKLSKDSNKSINIVIDNSNKNENPSSSNNNQEHNEKKEKDYTMYIFSGILLTVVLIGYLVFSIIKKKNNDGDV